MAYTKKTWVKGNTPLSAENFNHMEQGIADAHTDIAQLNSDKEYKTYSTDGISIEINSQCAMFYIRKSKSLTGGNTTQTLLDLPNGITLKNEVFAPCEIIDGSWTPYGNTGYINARNGQINARCKDSTSTSIVIAMFTVPRHFIQFG